MATSRQQRLMLMTMCCSMAALPALGDSMARHNLQIPAEIAGQPCSFTDPSDPQQILGPNPAHADCLSALYSPLAPGNFAAADGASVDRGSSGGDTPQSLSIASTLWFYVAGVGMLVLAGFNSRKRHRPFPAPDASGTFGPPAEPRTHREAGRWNDD